ncbi:hypothetical protein EVAR_70275_1 [Eumeta japonica]|uniref:Uncharacterized protein n=1 Tax=Eumeta variegata TaxID=151549 RepID=A0A4C1ZYS2_EUMVA|nr:hypothetical protein EVAR_70275_1 [Eumeta japonica]
MGTQSAPNKSTSEGLWCLPPHFAVTHPQKKKIRLVFDAAARTNGKCLNDALHTSPNLLRSLFGVFIQFRQPLLTTSGQWLRAALEQIQRNSMAGNAWRCYRIDKDKNAALC